MHIFQEHFPLKENRKVKHWSRAFYKFYDFYLAKLAK